MTLMRAMVLDAPGTKLREAEVRRPELHPGQVRIQVGACGVCRTDLHVRDGELPDPKLPLILGHEIVGTVVDGDTTLGMSARVGVPWLGWTCGECRFCAGLMGYRALRAAGDGERLGLYGFGAAAHIVAQLAIHERRRVFTFTRKGDDEAQSLARNLGAEWAGPVGERTEELDAAIIFAPAGELVPEALAALAKGGTVVYAGIHMSAIPSFPHELLWGERVVRSVANLTRSDGHELFRAVGAHPVTTAVEVFPLAAAEDALDRLRRGAVRGAAVLVVAEQPPAKLELRDPA